MDDTTGDTTEAAREVLSAIRNRLDGFDRLRIAAGLFRRRHRMLSLRYEQGALFLLLHGAEFEPAERERIANAFRAR